MVRSRVPLAQTEVEVFDSVMAVNARTVILTMRYAARKMRDGRRIVNISTMNTVRPCRASGRTLRARCDRATDRGWAARELGPRGITVYTDSPGATDTEILRGVNSSGALKAVARMTPLGRLGDGSDRAVIVRPRRAAPRRVSAPLRRGFPRCCSTCRKDRA
ncbi:SDR family oxidoreductase [Streptomyces sp. col6]|uniref:SDR family oxidoreductase n=1 Tax=Streptomyces sp. col6 TaxID=2478958 RepID=UPI0021E4E1C1|nr:SDR family oxidoreductase [Streptomyces sp. col6]